jgi:hypothetical protein
MKKFITSLFRTDLLFDRKIVTITIVSTLLLTIDYYHQLTRLEVLDRTILYLLVPLLIIVVVFRESPSAYGFRLGDWKAGLAFTLGSILLMTPVLFFLSRDESALQEYYALRGNGMPVLAYTFLEIFGWEFLFRGWILFGYERRFSGNAQGRCRGCKGPRAALLLVQQQLVELTAHGARQRFRLRRHKLGHRKTLAQPQQPQPRRQRGGVLFKHAAHLALDQAARHRAARLPLGHHAPQPLPGSQVIHKLVWVAHRTCG